MTLFQKQWLFVRLIPLLIAKAELLGLMLTFGEAWRPEAVAAEYAKPGGVQGIKNSLHKLRLAMDFNLFKDGVWLKDTADFKDLGEYWESLSLPGTYTCVWGGRFGDGNHFSIEHNGVK